MSDNIISISDALTTLSRAAGGRYVSIEEHHTLFEGRTTTEWLIYRADIRLVSRALTMETALANALKGSK